MAKTSTIHIDVKAREGTDTELTRYIGRLERAGDELMEALSIEMETKAIENAPEGKKADKRTRKLKDIGVIQASHTRYSAKVQVFARHGAIIEYGGGPSKITGRVFFYWEKYGRYWRPGDNVIEHPATHAKPYLRPALDDIMREWPDIAKQIYP